MRALFVCSRNRLRSPTAEKVFANVPGLEVDSAGLAPDADTLLTAEQVAWADVIFVMERKHRKALSQRFKTQLHGKRVVCLEIPDNYAFMDPALIEVLKATVPRHLRGVSISVK